MWANCWSAFHLKSMEMLNNRILLFISSGLTSCPMFVGQKTLKMGKIEGKGEGDRRGGYG